MESTYGYISKLRNSHVLVIGGTSGIGLCVAEAAVEYGAQVTICGSSEKKCQAALTRLRSFSSPFLPLCEAMENRIAGCICDLSDTAQQEHNLRTLLSRVTCDGAKQLDHVVFTAAETAVRVPVCGEVTVEQIHQIQAVRVLAPIMLAKLLPAYMKKSSKSSLTLTGGTLALRPGPDWSIMAGVISSMSGLTRGLAVDLQPIRVNLVIPGGVSTTAATRSSVEANQLEETMASFRLKTLTNSVGTPEEVAEAYLYFMRDAYATGSSLVTDGGKILK